MTIRMCVANAVETAPGWDIAPPSIRLRRHTYEKLFKLCCGNYCSLFAKRFSLRLKRVCLALVARRGTLDPAVQGKRMCNMYAAAERVCSSSSRTGHHATEASGLPGLLVAEDRTHQSSGRSTWLHFVFLVTGRTWVLGHGAACSLQLGHNNNIKAPLLPATRSRFAWSRR